MANNDNEPRIQLGKYENGVLEIREGFKKLDDESMEGYKYVRKVIFPASLEELDEDVFSETKELEELDFSRVSKLKEIPGDLVSCKTKITEFVIPQGVKVVDDGFLSEAKAGTKIFVPESVKQLGYINGNDDNDLYVYLFASGIDLDDVEADINTLYVLSKDYADYAEKLKDCDSEAKLREMPEELVNFYSTDGTSAVAVQLDSVAQPTTAVPPVPPAQSEQSVQPVPVVPAAVMSTPPPPPIPTSPKAENQPTAPSVNTAPHAVNQQQANNKNMANNLIPQELDQLIQEYLTDGVLTDKERAVILRKAESMGLDRDEIDLYLDAQIQKIDQATDAAVRKQKGKQCPYCGGSIPQLADKCPHCGENITAEASNELQEIFDKLEEALVNLKSAKDIHTSKATVERYARKAKMYYGSNPKVQKLLEEIEMETINAEKKAKSLARKNTLISILTYNMKLTIGAIVVLAIILFVGIRAMLPGSVTSDPQKCTEAIRAALKNNDVDTALSLYKGFDGETWDLGYSREDFGKAYLKIGEYDKAVDLCHKSRYDVDENYRLLCECIDKMKEEKSDEEIKKFILKYLSLFYDSDKEEYEKKLSEYAGI